MCTADATCAAYTHYAEMKDDAPNTCILYTGAIVGGNDDDEYACGVKGGSTEEDFSWKMSFFSLGMVVVFFPIYYYAQKCGIELYGHLKEGRAIVATATT